jgi:general secretion pathway protein N
MWRNALLFLALLVSSLLIQAPAAVWDGWLQRTSNGRLALLDANGSVWHGHARLSVRDAASGERIPVTPVSWQWRPMDFLRGRVGWAFSIAGLPPFTLAASPLGVSANSVAVQLPVREALDQIPNTVARSGWHGDFSLNADHWRCSWRDICEGHAEVFWRGAASDLFPNRPLGNYRLVIEGVAGNTGLKLDTLSGDVRLTANGQISTDGATQLQGSVEGDPAFVGRLPDVASRWVQRTGDPGRILFNFGSPVAAK